MSPGVQLDLYVREVVGAIAGGDPAGATRWLTTMRQFARAHGHRRYEAVADELAAALATATPLAELPRLVWGGALSSVRQPGDDHAGELG